MLEKIKQILDERKMFLSGLQIARLSKEQIAGLSEEQIAWLSEEQIAWLSARIDMLLLQTGK